MKTENLYSSKENCCGCELCAQLCPRSVIKMKEDEEGFLYPYIIDEETCINCKRCIRICPTKTPGRSGLKIESSFCYSMQDDVDLRKSASGGLATSICRAFIRRGGVVYGVAYSSDCLDVSFRRSTSLDELELFRGSKYVQAKKGNVYSLVESDLNSCIDVLFIGLPCEVSALYHAVGSKTEHLYTISLICHGPTSQKVHRDYCNSIVRANGSNLSFFSVRYKLTGWKPYYIHAELENGMSINELWNKSDYGVSFLYLKRPSCSKCKYKAEDDKYGVQADLVIGDFHGVNIQNANFYNRWGVSQGSVITEKGKFLASIIGGEYLSQEISYSVIKKSNRGMFVAIPQRGDRSRFVDDYIKHSLHYATHSRMVWKTNLLLRIRNQIFRFRAARRWSEMIIIRLNKILVS